MKKVRCDFCAQLSVVVAIPDDAEDDSAVEIAEEYLKRRSVKPQWELEDGGVSDADDTEVAINENE